jgi:hypothetical protein
LDALFGDQKWEYSDTPVSRDVSLDPGIDALDKDDNSALFSIRTKPPWCE